MPHVIGPVGGPPPATRNEILLREAVDRLRAQLDECRELLRQSTQVASCDNDQQCTYCRMDIARISRHAHCWQCGLTAAHFDDCPVGIALQETIQ
jgi:hypothetical protein